MKNRFTQKAQNTLRRAREQAERLGRGYVGTEHLLLGLVSNRDSAAARLLYARGVDEEALLGAIIKGRSSTLALSSGGDMTPRSKKVLENAALISARYMHGYIGTEHILLAILDETDSLAVKLLSGLGVSVGDLKGEIVGFLDSIAGEGRTLAVYRRKDAEGTNAGIPGAPTLSKYGKNLTAMAASGELDPIIGREEESERVIQILCRRTKNNPCLIGEPGVGKTAVVEGLAERIASGDVPELLSGKLIVTLDISAMVAGAKYRGEFEDRLKNVMDEVAKNPDIFLFIDEVHTIIGAGSAEGALDAANIIKPALSRGELQLIGATTLDEYRRHIERDAALERRFQPVYVGEPSHKDAVSILRGLRDRYEAHHKIRIPDDVIEAAVSLSERYINDRYLPDKAIDLIDEAASGRRIKTKCTPRELREAENKLATVKNEKEEAIATQDFERAATLRDSELACIADCERLRGDWERESLSGKDDRLTVDDIAATVTRMTGIPLSRIDESESERLIGLADRLNARVIGQKPAVEALTSAIIRSRSGLRERDRPTGSFIFCGPSGVGKTELCRALAAELFGSPESLIRLDMSEYMEKGSVARMIGSPPGYVGYGDGGQLTEAVRRRPYSVVLFDEIEKAHPDVFNILLGITDSGRLSDSRGRQVDFRNTVIIMTSNVGARFGHGLASIGFVTDGESDERHTKEALSGIFRPELLNRMDGIIVFSPLDRASISRICDIMLDGLKKRLAAVGVEAEFTASVNDRLICAGFDPQMGARPLGRALVSELEVPLSERIISGSIRSGDRIVISFSDGRLIVTPSISADEADHIPFLSE